MCFVFQVEFWDGGVQGYEPGGWDHSDAVEPLDLLVDSSIADACPLLIREVETDCLREIFASNYIILLVWIVTSQL